MDENRRIPVALKVVAILFIVWGVCAVIEVVLSLMRARISINFGVLGLFVGYGLLRLRPGWRTCGLVFLWIGMIGVPVVAFIMLSSSAPINFEVFGQKVGRASKEFALVMAVVMFVLCVWQYRVRRCPNRSWRF